MSSTGGHCYCGVPDIDTPYHFICDKCKRKFHEGCLITGLPSTLQGDYLFTFKCHACGGGEEEFSRVKLQWMQVVQLTLYNLQLSATGMFGYFRWKEHICTFIDKHWTTFFGSHRKKTSLWHGTVAGVLSSGCPGVFVSGAQELKETGWWRLSETKPPTIIKQGTPTPKNLAKKKETPPGPSPTDPPKEGLRSRRGKTSIQAAMELKAKRSTLVEAKDIRKTKLAKTQIDTSPLTSTPSISPQSSSLTAHLQSPAPVPGTSPPQSDFNVPSVKTPPDTHRPLAFTGLFQSSSKMETSQSNLTGSILAEHLVSCSSSGSQAMSSGSHSLTASLLSSQTGSVQDFSDESSNISQGSYLTEKDLKLQATLPSLLMCEDDTVQESDSDLEIDPGTMSPPPPGSPLRMQDSPTVQELLSTMDSESLDRCLSLEDSNIDNSNQESLDMSYQGSVSMDTSYHGSSSILSGSNHGSFSFFNTDKSYLEDTKTNKGDEDASVVDSESESESESASSAGSDVNEEQTGEQKVQLTRVSRKRKRRRVTEQEVETIPDINYTLMSSYEERLLLKKLESVSNHCTLPPHINRLKCKLRVKQLKREHGLPQFDLDAELNRLSQRCWGLQYAQKERQIRLPGNHYHGDMRVLDKFQNVTYSLTRAQLQKQPSFLNRLVGTEDDQLESIVSPYTARILKPFIRRDYESRPLKLKLLQEIKAYPHRNDSSWIADPPPPIDYCYVRPQHIASVNSLCREFFWPGIDVSDCLQYPDFSCVVLYRNTNMYILGRLLCGELVREIQGKNEKFIIGFSFMVPDVKQNEAYISFIFTHPEWRHAGIASFMLYHLIQTCMGKDVTLHVSATNTAMLMYQKFGFKPEEFILDFYDKYYSADTKDCRHAFFLRLHR